MIVILNELDTPDTRLEWRLALLHAATALRPEESFGLKWGDIDWKWSLIHIRRGWSKGKQTAGKNKVSMTEVALHPALAAALQDWRRETRYRRESDWVFASDRAKGKKPRSAGVAGQDYLRPAAVKAGVIAKGYKGRFGWHNLVTHSQCFSRERRKPAGNPSCVASRQADHNSEVHASRECRSNQGSAEVP
jgi:integrase